MAHHDRSVEEVKAELEGKLDRNEAPILQEYQDMQAGIDGTVNDDPERFGDWHETYSGVKFWTLDARDEEILLVDIAHALSLMCRFNGHCKHFYSVGQHSIYCVSLARRKGLSPRSQMALLLHDASEAYIADLIRPVKRFMPEYRTVEKQLQDKIYKKFGLVLDERDEAIVKAIDNLMLANEAKQLMLSGGVKWQLYDIKPEDVVVIQRLEPEFVEQEYLHRFFRIGSELWGVPYKELRHKHLDDKLDANRGALKTG